MNGKLLHNYNSFDRSNNNGSINKSIFWGVVVSIEDNSEGGIIKVRINGLDNKLTDSKIPEAYPLLPKFFHIYPKIGEAVRVFIEDPNYPQKGRFWMGSIISQPQKINFDISKTALSTTNLGVTRPEESPNTYPDAIGIYPKKNDVAILGRLNNDIILRDNEIELRAGKHENGNNLKLNKKNVGSIRIVYEEDINNKGEYYSSSIIQSDKIALISHNGYPKFKSHSLNVDDRNKIFAKSSPIPRGDVLVDILKKMINAIYGHIHPYAKMSVDRNDVIAELEKIDFNVLLNNNIVTN